MSVRDIFISYRRDGGFTTAKHLFDILARDGYAVSFDLDTLRNGRFDEALFSRIDECTDFIIILSKGCFDRTLDPGCHREDDWMRRELAHALKLEKNIIPIMLNGFNDFPSNLPSDIRGVALMKGPKYSREYFDAFYKRLKDYLKSSPCVDNQEDEDAEGSEESALLSAWYWFLGLRLKQKFGLALLALMVWFGWCMIFSSPSETVKHRHANPTTLRARMEDSKKTERNVKGWFVLAAGLIWAFSLLASGKDDTDDESEEADVDGQDDIDGNCDD